MIQQTVLAAAPLIIPLVTALSLLVLARRPHLQRAASLGGALLLLAATILLLHATSQGIVPAMRFGGWSAPFAIEFRVDALSALLLVVAALLAVVALSYAYSGAERMGSLWHPMIHGVLAGAGGAYATADLFNLYVWFEVMLVATLGLFSASRGFQHLEAGLKYLVLNVFGTVLLLIAVAGLYGLTGQLNFEALGAALLVRDQDPLALTLTSVLLVALLLKAGAFPFLFWLSASYPMLPAPVHALFTALMTKIAAYVVLRLSFGVLPLGTGAFATALGWIAVATMIVGVLGAVYHYDLRRILAFHSVSQMGYVLLAVALGGTAGAVAALFFVVHHILVKSNLYLIAGMIARDGSFDLRRTGGLYRSEPALALLFGVTAASLVGIPPLSGFWAKFLVVREGFTQSEYLWSAAALATGGLTLLSMAKIWSEAFWKPHPHPQGVHVSVRPLGSWLVCAFLALLALAMGLLPGPLLAFLGGALEPLATMPIGAQS